HQRVRALRESLVERVSAGGVADHVCAVSTKAIHSAELQRVFAGKFGEVRFAFIAVRYIERAGVATQARHLAWSKGREAFDWTVGRDAGGKSQLRGIKPVGKAVALIQPARPGEKKLSEESGSECLSDL